MFVCYNRQKLKTYNKKLHHIDFFFSNYFHNFHTHICSFYFILINKLLIMENTILLFFFTYFSRKKIENFSTMRRNSIYLYCMLVVYGSVVVSGWWLNNKIQIMNNDQWFLTCTHKFDCVMWYRIRVKQSSEQKLWRNGDKENKQIKCKPRWKLLYFIYYKFENKSKEIICEGWFWVCFHIFNLIR